MSLEASTEHWWLGQWGKGRHLRETCRTLDAWIRKILGDVIRREVILVCLLDKLMRG